ncbi:MAG: cAMP-binding protein, partial [Paenibacillus sp.]|nr:cAMP-binding protein [Paenibacillus sp.]
MITTTINKIPFFTGLDQLDVLSISNLFLERTYKKGSSIFFYGDTGEEMYIIKSGSIKIFR